MRPFHHWCAAAFVVCSLAFVQTRVARAQKGPSVQSRPSVRIVSTVENAHLVRLPQTHPARISGLTDAGRVDAATPFQNMLLVLQSSDAQEQALHELLDQQQDKTHPNFHRWMTPDTFGAAFGLASSDIGQVKTWLEQNGFTITAVAKGGRVIQFSGTSGQVETAFHTEMHHYLVNGETRISNATDIAIPQALAPVVAGLSSLNNFHPTHSLHAVKVNVNASGKVTSTAPISPTAETSLSGSTTFPSGHFVGGADFAKLYNTAPLLASGVNGTGVTIGIIGQSDVLLSDVQTYRTLFGLPANNFHRIQVGSDPGTTSDDGESDLDLEVSGAMAPNATINFYTSGEGYFGGGIDSAMEYVIEDNDADIISLSYGECEQNLGAGGNAFYSIIYEQAAAQGQSIFVSTGDSGPDVCDAGNSYATSGYSVNGLASTPYNVAVGGTQFNEGPTYSTPGTTPFWSSVNTVAAPFASALGYIPEQPWNESAFGTGALGGLLAGGSGVSLYYPTPSYQIGPGVPTSDPNPPAGSSIPSLLSTSFTVAGPHRYLPDVSLNASVFHDGTIFCSAGSCTLTATGGLSSFGIVGGTSVAAPLMAGAQALINQANGGRQGVPNYFYYKLAAAQSTTACVATDYVTSAGCAFHDSQAGNNDVPSSASGSTEIGWNAAPQYDLAVGLGSPDVAHLASGWSTVNFNATTTAFTLSPTNSAHGTSVDVTVQVTPASGTGTPTGNVAIVAQALNGSLGFYTLSNGAVNRGLLNGLPAGTYNVYARYSGDSTFGASTSAPVQVTVSTESTTVAAATSLLTPTGKLTAANSFPYGSNIFISAGVTAPSRVGVPTGAITFTLNNGTSNLTPYVTQLDPNGASVGNVYYSAGAFFDSGLGLPAYNISSTFPLLSPGTYTASVSYAGDSTFLASKLATPLSFIVSQAATSLSLTTPNASTSSGATASLTATIATVAASVGGVPATGNITFTDANSNTVLGSASLSNGVANFSTNGIVIAGPHTITATYAGDSNYAAQSASVTITVAGAASSVSLSVTPSDPQVLTPVVLTAAVSTGTTGTVSFSDAGVLLGSAAINPATSTATLIVKTFSAGTHSLTAAYQGSSTETASTSAVINLTVAHNTPGLAFSSQQTSSAPAAIALQSVLSLSPSNGASAAAVAPSGSVQYFDQPTASSTPTSLGTAPLAYASGANATYIASLSTTALKPGYHTLSSTYAGDANYAAAVSNAQTIAIGITSLQLSSSSASVGTNVPFAIQAIVTPAVATNVTIGGSVTFYDGAPATGTVLGTVSVSNGSATLSTAFATASTHIVTAIYSGDANFYTSTFSSGINIVSLSPGFTMDANPTSLTLKAGSSGTLSLSLTSFGNYSGTASLACTGLPAYTTCSFAYPANESAQTITFTGANNTQAATVTLRTVSPTGPNTQPATLLWIPALVFAGLLCLRRKQLSSLSRHWLVLALLLCGTIAVSGCGTDLGPATPAGTFNVNVVANATGQATASPNLQVTVPVALTVGY